MSYLIPYAASGFALLTAIFIVFFLDQRSYAKKYKVQITALEEDLNNWKSAARGANNYPASKWKEIAMYHAKQHSGTRAHFEREHKYLRELIDVLNQKLEVRDLEFRYLVVHLWGDPPLDRSMQNVMDLIDELRTQPGELMQISIATNRHMKRYAQTAADLQQQLQELQQKYSEETTRRQTIWRLFYALTENGWVCLETRKMDQHKGLDAVYTVFKTPDKLEMKSVIGEGINPEEAVKEALKSVSGDCPA